MQFVHILHMFLPNYHWTNNESMIYCSTLSWQSIFNSSHPCPRHLFHILLSKIHQHTSNCTLSRLGPTDGQIRIHGMCRCIRGIIPIREAYFKRRRWVAHEERSPGHVGDAIRVGMGEFEKFGFSFPHQPHSLGIRASPLGIETASQISRLIEEDVTIDDPSGEGFK